MSATRRDFLAGMTALFVVPLLPPVGASPFVAPTPAQSPLGRTSLIDRLRKSAELAGLPVKALRVEDLGEIETAPVTDDDGNVITPSYPARAFRFALNAPCCGETLEAISMIDVALLRLVPDRDALIVGESVPFFEAMSDTYRMPCPHGA